MKPEYTETVYIHTLLRENETIYINKVVEPVSQPAHYHDFLELEYVISGKGIHRVGNVEIEVGSGYVFFTNFDTPHCFLSQSEKDPIILYNCVFQPETLSNVGLDFASFVSVANDRLFKIIFPQESKDTSYLGVFDYTFELKHIFETMFHEYTAQKEGYNSVLLGCLIQLLICFMRLYETQYTHSTSHSIKEKYLTNILQYIQTHYTESLSLQELASIALLSPNYLCKVFKDVTGRSISEYIQQLRLKKVCDLLETYDYSLEEIAQEVGYQNAGYLSRVFKKEYGQTPSEYRRKIVK